MKAVVIPGDTLNPFAWCENYLCEDLECLHAKFDQLTGEAILLPAPYYEFKLPVIE